MDGGYPLGHGSSSGESERGSREAGRKKRGALGTGSREEDEKSGVNRENSRRGRSVGMRSTELFEASLSHMSARPVREGQVPHVGEVVRPLC
jgi:hypothetical protein